MFTPPENLKEWSYEIVYDIVRAYVCAGCGGQPGHACEECGGKGRVPDPILPSRTTDEVALTACWCICCGAEDVEDCGHCWTRVLLECPACDEPENCHVCSGRGFVSRRSFAGWVWRRYNQFEFCPECKGDELLADCGRCLCGGLMVAPIHWVRDFFEKKAHAARLQEESWRSGGRVQL